MQSNATAHVYCDVLEATGLSTQLTPQPYIALAVFLIFLAIGRNSQHFSYRLWISTKRRCSRCLPSRSIRPRLAHCRRRRRRRHRHRPTTTTSCRRRACARLAPTSALSCPTASLSPVWFVFENCFCHSFRSRLFQTLVSLVVSSQCARSRVANARHLALQSVRYLWLLFKNSLFIINI